jgi:hypothetical protein
LCPGWFPTNNSRVNDFGNGQNTVFSVVGGITAKAVYKTRSERYKRFGPRQLEMFGSCSFNSLKIRFANVDHSSFGLFCNQLYGHIRLFLFGCMKLYSKICQVSQTKMTFVCFYLFVFFFSNFHFLI